MRQPYFKKSRQTWYVNDANGKPIKLGKSKDEAWEAWRKMDPEAPVEDKPVEVKPSPRSGRTLAGLVTDYLEWVGRNREKATYVSYERSLRPLVEQFGDLPALEIRPFHLDKVVQAKTDPKAVQAEAKRKKLKLKVWSETTCWQLYKAAMPVRRPGTF